MAIYSVILDGPSVWASINTETGIPAGNAIFVQNTHSTAPLYITESVSTPAADAPYLVVYPESSISVTSGTDQIWAKVPSYTSVNIAIQG